MGTSRTTRRTPSWLITISLIAISLCYYLFSFRPNQAVLSKLAADLAANQQALASLETLPAQLQRTRGELNEASAFVKEFHRRAPARPSSAAFGAISEAVVVAGCRTTRFDPQAADEFDTLHRSRASLEFEGGFAEVLAALAALETGSQPTWIEELRISPGRIPHRDVHCTVTVSVFSAKAVQPD